MFVWWNSLDTVLKVLYCIAIPATLVLVVQTIMMLLGFGESDVGMDASDVSGLDLDTDVDIDAIDDMSAADFTDGSSPVDFSAMRLITLQTVIAFMTVFGWSSIVTLQTGGNTFTAFVIGSILGVISMFLLAKLAQVSSRLAENGTQNIRYALGQTATVYLPIPPEGKGFGKVTLTLQGQFAEFEAMQDGDATIAVGTAVRIIDLRDGMLIVEK